MIKAGDKLVTKDLGATISIGTVGIWDAEISIRKQWLNINDIKQLRKFLKKLQRQLEQADLANLE